MLALEAVTHEQRHAFDTEDTPFVYESTPPWHQTDRRMTRQFVSRRVEQSELLKIEETFSLPISYQLPKIGMLTHPNVDRGNCCELCESAQTPYMYSSVLNDRLQNGVKRRVMIDLDCQGHLPEGECLTFGDCSNKLACVDLVSSFKFNSSYTFTTFTIEPTPIIDLATSRAQANPHILGMRLKNGLVKMALWDSKILRSLKVMYKCRSYVLHMFQIMVKVEHRAGLRERRDDLRALSGFVEASSLTCHTVLLDPQEKPWVSFISPADSAVSTWSMISSLRVFGSVGEPINTEAWNWYNEHVGKKHCAIVDTFWRVRWRVGPESLPGSWYVRDGATKMSTSYTSTRSFSTVMTFTALFRFLILGGLK
ncbi:hypothetical protein EDD22DRAFT_854778, partial [Suillus occidentalis]